MPTAGTVQLLVTWPPVWLPTNRTRSAEPTTRLALDREYRPQTPTDSGWLAAIAPLPLSDVATGMDRFSASSTSSAQASDAITPPPATMTGRSAAASACAAAATLAAAGSGRNAGRRRKASSTTTSRSASSSAASVRMSRCAGLGVPVVTSRKACRSRSGIRSTRSTDALNFVTGPKKGI